VFTFEMQFNFHNGIGRNPGNCIAATSLHDGGCVMRIFHFETRAGAIPFFLSLFDAFESKSLFCPTLGFLRGVLCVILD
jgi:hypothetical protein